MCFLHLAVVSYHKRDPWLSCRIVRLPGVLVWPDTGERYELVDCRDGGGEHVPGRRL
jgi:hypothetical protein